MFDCIYTYYSGYRTLPVLVALARPGGLPSGLPFLLAVPFRDITAWRSLRGEGFHCVFEVGKNMMIWDV